MPIRSSVTVSLVPEARGGPFVFWDDLPAACQTAAQLGFDAIELFPTDPRAIDPRELDGLLAQHQLQLAAMGTGAGWLRQRLTLSNPDPARRRSAIEFVQGIIDLAGKFGAPAIVGSMQGRWGDGSDRDSATTALVDSLGELALHAKSHGVPLLYEPLNRYETNICNTLAAGVELIQRNHLDNVKLLADLFHMNIEESNPAQAIVLAGERIGHLHFVDSNRQPVGRGHIDLEPIVSAFGSIGYDGYASAEALPIPSPDEAAALTMRAFRRYFRRDA